ncbi:MAG: hypothetical protein US37_C0006G0008 [Candidatus Moranbacteria bacterium GW2011_GWF2_37_11]|nr:MAG: hypothetical protein US37_C0006G0008 [Candidatus Moranbacteria bacterium GW2011_GWF2_37_11]KKQ46993.1 MAG: hypothetical protein US66_C0022G0006 [Candidatus Moranbacteria bacterium GW2011_GWD2_37_9]
MDFLKKILDRNRRRKVGSDCKMQDDREDLKILGFLTGKIALLTSC